MAYENYGAYSTYQVPAFGNVIPIRRKPISGPFIMGYAAAPAGRASGTLQSSAGMGYFGAPAGLAEAAIRGKLRSSAGMGYFGAPAGGLVAARTRPGVSRSESFGAPAGRATNPAGYGSAAYTGPSATSGDIDPSTGHPWGEINPATGTYWPPIAGGGAGGGTPAGGGTDYAGIAQLVTALGTVGLAGVNTILTQMNHDQLMQAQRDAQALAASGSSAQAATLNAAIVRALSAQAQSANQPSQGMSTNTVLIIGGVALVGLYLFMQKGGRRHNPVVGRGRRRRYVRSHHHGR